MNQLKTWLFICTFLLAFQGQSQSVQIIDSTLISNLTGSCISCISFRGMSVPNNKVVWISGSKGSVARSTNGGKSFELIKIPGYESFDFRSIYAFNDKKAIVVNSGSPAYILKTFDGGNTWRKVYEDLRQEIFLDAIDFWDEEKGMVLGDPIDERFMLIKTSDGGNTWYEMDTSMRPWAIPGESVFAASGTSFRCMKKNSLAFVTGGSKSVFHWLEIDKKYQRHELKTMVQGKASEGAFSFDYNAKYIAVVGGDYASDTTKIKQALYRYAYDKDGLQLLNMKTFYTYYKSSVALLEKGNLVSCGTLGVAVNHTEQTTTLPGQKTYISTKSFNVVRKARKGNLTVLAGPKGTIGVFQP
ncbi:MAG: YCF48-related protein [Bacteroidota bacterium]|nr:YCF48-related protein [Bacteroidota bacterium]